MSETPQIGWPWCGDVLAGRSAHGEATATRHPDDSITLAWQPEDARSTIVSREVLDGIVDERNRLTRANREHEQRAGLLRRQVAELEASLDVAADAMEDALKQSMRNEAEAERLRRQVAHLEHERDATSAVALDYARERDDATTSAAQARRVLAGALDEVRSLRADLTEARAETDRARKALDAVFARLPQDVVDRLHREAGLG